MQTKKATELRTGDRIVAIEDRPNINVYRGTVGATTPVPDGVQIHYQSGGSVTVDEGATLKIATDDAEWARVVS
jgi:hypothetical protein